MGALHRNLLRPGQFFGEARRSSAVGGLVLSDVVHRQPRRLPEHEHIAAYYSLVVAGSYREVCAGREYCYRRAAIMYHPEGTRHWDEIGPSGARLFLAELTPDWFARLDCRPAAIPALAEPRFLHTGPVPGLGRRLFRELQGADECSSLVVEGLMLEMVGETVRNGKRPPSSPPAWLAATLERMHEEVATGWTLRGLASQIGVEPAELATVFRRHQGETVGEHLRGLRVAMVCERLTAEPDASLADLAAVAGFADQSHLTRVFRRLTGTTPGAFRAALQQRPGGSAILPSSVHGRSARRGVAGGR
jgi:AraC family transcriptional regulator